MMIAADELRKFQYSSAKQCDVKIDVYVYFSCLPSSCILCYGLVSTTKKDEDLIENILCGVSKMLPRLSNLTNQEKHAKIEIPSMKYC